MNPSKKRNNWISVGEIIRLVKEPVALYTSHIIENWHVTLYGRLPLQCSKPGNCESKEKPHDLCFSCKEWYDALAKAHWNEDKRQIKWRENCNTTKWPNDPWKVAKFFMPVLEDDKTTVKDAEFTDLSSFLSVLAWMKDVAFALDRRVDRSLVEDIRSKFGNSWAHGPKPELTESIVNDAFDIALTWLLTYA